MSLVLYTCVVYVSCFVRMWCCVPCFRYICDVDLVLLIPFVDVMVRLLGFFFAVNLMFVRLVRFYRLISVNFYFCLVETHDGSFRCSLVVGMVIIFMVVSLMLFHLIFISDLFTLIKNSKFRYLYTTLVLNTSVFGVHGNFPLLYSLLFFLF